MLTRECRGENKPNGFVIFYRRLQSTSYNQPALSMKSDKLS